MKKEKLFNTMFALAQSLDKVANARIVAAITLKNDVISFGFNQRKSHPFQKKYSVNEDSIYLHAEVDAIKNALKVISDLKNCSLFVSRVKFNKKGGPFVPGISCPCEGCKKAIVAFGIKKVFYTENNALEFSCL
jgi:deoxycytidylate deaminase